ncbi:MAG TPA: hypothetical protein VJ547_12655 [Candidatus Thermoplasmatota archaeon]|nr:hypothetical protein [Candidatus Thermoplasmatota archaeon]
MPAYRITARALERQLVGEKVLKEFESLEDCSVGGPALSVAEAPGHPVVLVLEEDEGPHAASPRPQ